MQQSRSRSDSFKRDAVRRLIARGTKSADESAKELVASSSMVQRWRQRFEAKLTDGTRPSQGEREEVERLRREPRDVKAESTLSRKVATRLREGSEVVVDGLNYAERANILVTRGCRALEVSRSGYYQWLHAGPSERALDDAVLAAEIKEVFHEQRERQLKPGPAEFTLRSSAPVGRSTAAGLFAAVAVAVHAVWGCTPAVKAEPWTDNKDTVADALSTRGRESLSGEDQLLLHRYADDLAFIARPRPSGSPHWQAVQDYCAKIFRESGLDVELQAYGTGVNVIGRRGPSTRAGVVMASAHYDSLPGCPGADDNASGVAAVLALARLLSRLPLSRSFVLACWDQEEDGLLGSTAYVRKLATAASHDVGSREALELHFVFEMIGYYRKIERSQQVPNGLQELSPLASAQLGENGYRGDFIAMLADSRSSLWASQFERSAQAMALPVLRLDVPAGVDLATHGAHLGRSDHASFWRAGLPSILLTDTANYRNPHYHCWRGEDALDTIDLASVGQVIKATRHVLVQALDE
jgi:transposase-like protein